MALETLKRQKLKKSVNGSLPDSESFLVNTLNQIQSDIRELRQDNKELRHDNKEIRQEINTNFKWMVGIMLSGFGIMLSGFIGIIAIILSL